MNENRNIPSKPIILTLVVSSIVCLILSLAWTFISHPVIMIAIGVAPIDIFVFLLFVIFSFFRIHEALPLI